MKITLSVVFCLIFAFTVLGQQRIGSMAEVFNGTSLEGKDIYLDQYRGNVVVLNFWSTRCVICHEEIPKLNKLSQKHAGKDVVFLALTMENETKVSLYLQKRPFQFTIVPNSLGVLLKYADRDNRGNVNMGFPAYFIINQAGELVHKSSGWDKTGQIDSTITKLLSSGATKIISADSAKKVD
jgi:peroxiredoxin